MPAFVLGATIIQKRIVKLKDFERRKRKGVLRMAGLNVRRILKKEKISWRTPLEFPQSTL